MVGSPAEDTSLMPRRGLCLTHGAARDYAGVTNFAISTYRHDALASCICRACGIRLAQAIFPRRSFTAAVVTPL